MVLLISIGVFLSLMLYLVLIHQVLTADQRAVERLEQLAGQSEASFDYMPGEEGAKLKGIRGIIRRLGQGLGSSQWERGLDRRLQRADLAFRGNEYVVICLGLLLFGFAAGFFGSGGNLILALSASVLLGLIPFVIIRVRIQRRTKAFNDQLCDALVLIANSLRTGYSFIQAFDMVAREMQPPISTEFSRTMNEMNLGTTAEDALGKMGERINSKDMDLVITAVLIQRQVGGNLAEIIDKLAHTIRERVRIRGEIRTLTAHGRISGLVISLLPIALGVIIYAFNSEYISLLFTHPVGLKVLVVAGVSQIIGILVIRRIISIEV